MENQKFAHWQWIPLAKPVSIDFYRQWLKDGLHGDMKYLETSAETKSSPQTEFAGIQSIIVLTEDYFPLPESENFPLKNLKIAHYATNEDYHVWLRAKITDVCKLLKQKFPEHEFLAFTDAVPLLERDHAYQAGLGWVGKNTCLIHPKKGSLFFIGEILSTMPCEPFDVSLSHDFCGTCRRCIEECPTQAITEPRILDATRCIAYWTIEAKEAPPEQLREKIGDWFFGCDICQTVCPWNIKIHKNSANFDHQRPVPPDELENELRWILTTSNKSLVKALGRTPLTRAGGRGLKRNAIIVAGNKKLSSLRHEIEAFCQHPNLADVAQWALKRL